ncbi:hypothetical protein GCM10010124_17540 [Pilimelia terevasa]|uniref:Uncharacterized protein n=2 Tax=Pilimelia terevasa TaxID=53372 RepID=A0A8J3BSV1_9ACTN|nr:hypothetical protein GCM10010124_17540 [Pilimelia terevasa]
MRCGSDSWGFRHIVKKGRWNSDFERMMVQTTASGEWRAGHGFILKDGTCPPKDIFKVIFNYGAHNGNGIKPQGVITAYHVTGKFNSGAERCLIS